MEQFLLVSTAVWCPPVRELKSHVPFLVSVFFHPNQITYFPSSIFPDSEQPSISSPQSTDITGPVVGGVVAVVVVVLVVVGVVITTYLVVRHRRVGAMYVIV